MVPETYAFQFRHFFAQLSQSIEVLCLHGIYHVERDLSNGMRFPVPATVASQGFPFEIVEASDLVELAVEASSLDEEVPDLQFISELPAVGILRHRDLFWIQHAAAVLVDELRILQFRSP